MGVIGCNHQNLEHFITDMNLFKKGVISVFFNGSKNRGNTGPGLYG